MAESEQPLLPHVRQAHRLEETAEPPRTLLSCLCCGSCHSKIVISPEERDALWLLRDSHCNKEFDAASPAVDKQFCDIWNLVYPDERIEEAAQSQNWKRLGFQGTNPRTDVRTGSFPLDQLHYMAVTYPQRLQSLCRQAKDLDYFFAITCFNLSHMVLVFFDLVNAATVSPVSGAAPANKVQIKNFAELCNASRDDPVIVLNELFVALVELMHGVWKDMRASKNCNVMQHFPEAMKQIFERHAAFWNHEHGEVAQLRELTVLEQAGRF